MCGANLPKRRDVVVYGVHREEFGRVDDRRSFDSIVRTRDIREPGLDCLAAIVRGAETSRPVHTPQSAALPAIAQRLSANFRDDRGMLKHGMAICEARYAWCRRQVAGFVAAQIF